MVQREPAAVELAGGVHECHPRAEWCAHNVSTCERASRKLAPCWRLLRLFLRILFFCMICFINFPHMSRTRTCPPGRRLTKRRIGQNETSRSTKFWARFGGASGRIAHRRSYTQDLAGQTSSTAMGGGSGAITDAAIVATKQAKQINKPWYQIDPRKSKVMGYWDSITGLALIFTALVTPFEVAFLEAAESAGEPMFIVNRCMQPSSTASARCIGALVHSCVHSRTRALVRSCIGRSAT